MKKELFIKVDDTSITIALLEDGKLVEIHKEKRNKRFSVGDLYLGKVKKIMNGLNAAFIDIGYKRDAFLHYSDLGPKFLNFNKYVKNAINNPKNVPNLEDLTLLPDINKYGKISDVLIPGQSILVQIVKEPISSKGPRLTAEIAIAGRYIVLVPFSNKVSVSQKIRSKAERERLKQLLLSIKPNNYGIIARTVSQNRGSHTLDTEMRQLLNKWKKTVRNLENASAPKLVLSELDTVSAYLRDVLNETFDVIYINDQNYYYKIKNFLRQINLKRENLLRLYTEPKDLFTYFNIDRQIKSAFSKVVNLKKGAYLIIEHTEALHVIDVNSGVKTFNKSDQNLNAYEVNMLAAEEIVRQIRLRNMGGIIIIDFIDMYDEKNKQLVYEKVKKLMSTDRAKHSILPLTKFGLMQITRQRLRQEVSFQTTEPCPVCQGTGEIIDSFQIIETIEEILKQIVSTQQHKKIILQVHPFIYAYLKRGLYPLSLRWKIKYHLGLRIYSNRDFHLFEYQFIDGNGKKINL